MNEVPAVDLDADKFKYILIKVSEKDSGREKLIVRGYKWAGYHADILDKVEEELKKKNLSCECVGGGRILHHPDEKSIHVYGYSQGFGRADHAKTVEILKQHYHDYSLITWSNEGY